MDKVEWSEMKADGKAEHKRDENIASFTAELFSHPGQSDWSERRTEDLDGYLGVLQWCARAGIAFTNAEISLGVDWDQHSWYVAMSAFVELAMREENDDKDLFKLAYKMLKDRFTKDGAPRESENDFLLRHVTESARRLLAIIDSAETMSALIQLRAAVGEVK
jgi:hypothetical protein